MLPKSTKTTDDQQTAGKRKASSSAHDFPDANSDPGKRAREADVASRGGKLSAFNHTGPIKPTVIAMGAGGPMEAPDTTRGDDDGYDSETERGRYARRVGVGREHLKDTLSAIRAVSDEATTATRPPSPRRLRGGRPAPEKNASRTALTLPDISADADADAATKLTTFAFAGFQTLKEN